MRKRPGRGRPPHDDLLTPAEWRTLHAVQHGMSNATIARGRGVSVSAIKYHVRSIREKLGIEQRAQLRRWFRAPRDSALHRVADTSKRGSHTVNELQLGAIGQIARTVRDIHEAKAWYGNVLGLPHLYTFGDLAFFDCAGTRLMLTAQHGARADESILYLKVGDIQSAYQTLLARGANFVAAPHIIHRHADGTEEWMAFLHDPEGRTLAIMAQARPAA
jgi:DNA-binding CsgD family transcriptional regulator/predicted enzyme related to lactoylglutathione lyase